MLPFKFTTILDLMTAFPDERSCHQYLAGQRWNGLMTCPHEGCNGEECYVFSDGIRYKCKTCNLKFTAKTGSIFEASKLPMIKWFIAIYLVMHKKGISSVQLAKDLGVTQKTAWFILQRLRWAFGNEDKAEKIKGTVEIDETFVGGRNKNRHYHKRMVYTNEQGARTWGDKTPVFGMYCRETGKVRANVIDAKKFADIGLEIVRNIDYGSVLMTDDWKGYGKLEYLYTRFSIDHSRKVYADGEITTNRIENFWSHFKRGMHGTYISVTRKHLNKYVQEFAFRFNCRNFTIQQSFETLFSQIDCRLKYKALIGS